MKKFKLIVLSAVTVLTVVFSVIELSLRAFGFQPLQLSQQKGSEGLFTPELRNDTRAFYEIANDSMRPEQKDTSFCIFVKNGSYQYESTYTPQGTRYTGQKWNTELPNIHLLGCSYVEAVGLFDDATAAYKLQSMLAGEYNVLNHGMPGAGPSVFYHKFQKLLEEYQDNDKNIVIVGHAYFDEERNFYSHAASKALLRGHSLNAYQQYRQAVKVPKLRVGDDGVPHIEIVPMKKVRGLWLLRRSASVNTVDDLFTLALRRKWPPLENKNITNTIAIYKHMQAICHELGWDFYVMNIDGDPKTKRRFYEFSKERIAIIDPKVNTLAKEFSLRPYDRHPNGTANTIFAEEMYEHIRSSEGFAQN